MLGLEPVSEKRQRDLRDLLGDCGFEDQYLNAGEVLFQEGDPGGTFYLVRGGRLRAVKGLGTEDARMLGEIGRDESVGEMAVLGETTRSASVVAVRDSRVMKFCGEDIDDLPKTTLVELMRNLADRLKRTSQESARPGLPSTLAIVPINREVPLEDYCRHLADSMDEAGKTSDMIGSGDLPEEMRKLLDQEEIGADGMLMWVEDREDACDMLFLKADYELSMWTRRCLRYADAILLLGKAGTDSERGETEARVEEMQQGAACPAVFLVLIQDEQPYGGTAEWLRDRKVVRHFQVRLNSDEDKHRAARLMTGTDVSLALGGGGARGFAHIGMLRAFDELGIPIDRIGGTSMGGVISALHARGMGWKEVRETVRRHFIEEGRLTDYTLPLLSIDTGKRYIGMLERMFGDLQIEDLPLNFFCISCNLTQAKPVVHRRGSLAKWIGASVSVPGIAPPLVESGELLVDGGLLNNLPVDVIKGEGAGTVIGVDVSPDTDLRMPVDYFGRPGAMEVLRSILPFGKRSNGNGDSGDGHGYPTLGNILYRATCLSSIYQKESLKDLADMYIKLPVSQYKMLEWERIDDLVEIGYRVGMEKLRPLAEARAALEED